MTPDDVPRVVHQYRRARYFASAFTATYTDPFDALQAAQELTPSDWRRCANRVGVKPPSGDTIALTIERLRERTET